MLYLLLLVFESEKGLFQVKVKKMVFSKELFFEHYLIINYIILSHLNFPNRFQEKGKG